MYFKNLEPQQRVVDAVKDLIRNDKVDIYIMSTILPDSKYALNEKNEWLDKFLPEITEDKRIFPPCGDNKVDYVPGGSGLRTCFWMIIQRTLKYGSRLLWS